jgi:hypothetical protein
MSFLALKGLEVALCPHFRPAVRQARSGPKIARAARTNNTACGAFPGRAETNDAALTWQERVNRCRNNERLGGESECEALESGCVEQQLLRRAQIATQREAPPSSRLALQGACPKGGARQAGLPL